MKPSTSKYACNVTLRIPPKELRKMRATMARWSIARRKAVLKVLEEYARKIHEEAVRLCPVDTGNLRSTIEVILDKVALRVLIGTDKTAYALFVEYGTSKRGARPFMRLAFRKYADEFVEALKDAMKA